MSDVVIVETDDAPTDDTVVVAPVIIESDTDMSVELDHESRITALEMRMNNTVSRSEIEGVYQRIEDVAIVTEQVAEVAVAALVESEIATETAIEATEEDESPPKEDELPTSKKHKWWGK